MHTPTVHTSAMHHQGSDYPDYEEMKAALRTEWKCQPASLEFRGGDEVPAKRGVKSVDVERVCAAKYVR